MTDKDITSGGADSAQGSAQTASGGAEGAETSPAKRAYEGILSELKTERQKRRELEERVQATEAEKLLEQGKLKEYADTLKTQLEKASTELKSMKQSFAFTTVKGQIEREASRLGCVDTELLLKAIDLDKIQVDDAFNVETQSLSQVLEATRKSKPYLFKHEGPKVKDGVPVPTTTSGKPDFSKMTKQQLIEFARATGLN